MGRMTWRKVKRALARGARDRLETCTCPKFVGYVDTDEYGGRYTWRVWSSRTSRTRGIVAIIARYKVDGTIRAIASFECGWARKLVAQTQR